MGQTKVSDIIGLMEEWAPKKFAYDWDPVGLQIGRPDAVIDRVLVTLDVTEEVVKEAAESSAGLIIAHHPLIFRPMKSVRTDTPQGRIVEACIRNGISVFAAHTNLDVAPGGVNDMLAERLGLRETAILTETYVEPLYKLAVYTPHDSVDKVREALGKAGAGAIGDYVNCTYEIEGTGRFTPAEGADPYIGKIGKSEAVEETKIEVVLTASIRSKVEQAMIEAHPYEEPAYDFFVLDQRLEEYGIGRIGKLGRPMSLQEFAEHVKERLGVPVLRVVDGGKPEIRTVAVLGGSGGKYTADAANRGADVLVTGDIDFHTAQDTAALGLSIVDPGHHIERIMVGGVAERLGRAAGEKGLACTFIESGIITEPFRFI
ncbi:Nif3-like dinuclear metal center hexameric protein [Edaphobacillus lindanitolerans]|uniref:GTP cyclohydrolase 1 type 2 homolog n=1 Tax=Edaphobacillus lindanitolerans TaxID=550447 RepID=A0A1U7PPY6_9BACI|nr:Nif3-like dinuclear metal center hexameric protein [Edaphobacillus lindanitolerans]SIT82213.1 dinuclear metal center protein, YbgI/SA1388 family [Edaphobacillus lindanitolerans]